MSVNKTGGPAFPVADGKEMFEAPGMDLRDYFAAKAMHGYCASTPGKEWSEKWLAKESYVIADEMLKAREA